MAQNNQIARRNPQPNNSLELAQEFGQSQGYIETIKNSIAKGASDDELRLFLTTCKRTGLDPMARQIYAIKRGSGENATMTIQISVDGLRAIADKTGCYLPAGEPEFTFKTNGELETATAFIQKYAQGSWHLIQATAFYDEYCQKYNGKPNNMWAKMPRTMLAKCAESLALRKAFPAALSGLYSTEEMGQSEHHPEPETDNQPAPVNANLSLVKPPETTNENPEPQTEQPKSLFRQLAELMEVLNQNGDSVQWNKYSAAEYANTFFGDYEGFDPIKSIKDLDKEFKKEFLGHLTERLETLLNPAPDEKVIDIEPESETKTDEFSEKDGGKTLDEDIPF